MKVGEQASYRVVVRGNGVGAFTIEELADQGNGVSVVTIGAASPVHTIVVNFTPTRPGTYEEEIQLNTSLKSGAKVRLTISAEVDAQ